MRQCRARRVRCVALHRQPVAECGGRLTCGDGRDGRDLSKVTWQADRNHPEDVEESYSYIEKRNSAPIRELFSVLPGFTDMSIMGEIVDFVHQSGVG